MKKDAVNAIEKVLSNQKLAEIFFKLESLEDAYKFLQNFGSNFSIEELHYVIDEMNKTITSEELKYIVNETSKPITSENLKYLINETAKSGSPEELVYMVDNMIEEMSNSKLEDNMLLAVAGGNQMTNTLKKFTSAGMAAMLTLTGTTAGASSPNTAFQNSTVVESKKLTDKEQKSETLTKDEESTWQTVKKKLGDYWSKTPKAVKVFGGIALFSVPVIIGGRIFYVNKIKPSFQYTFGVTKLSFKREEIKIMSSNSELGRMLMALLLVMPGYLVMDQSYETCLTEIDLLQLGSEQEIRDRINSLNRDDLFSLSKLFQLQTQLNQETVNGLKEKFKQGQLPENEINDLSLLVKGSISGLPKGNLKAWIGTVSQMVSERLQELNQETLSKHNLTIKKSLGGGQSGNVYLCTNKEGQEVAVKVIYKNGGFVSELAIKNEGGVWKQIKDVKSDNIVKYKNHFSRSGIDCFSMEYVNDAKELLSVKPKDRAQIIDWAKQIFTGLRALHEKNVAHRDIKLENILLTNDNQIKICDFGLAKRADLTVSVCGTPGMMAPEVQRYFPFVQKMKSKYSGSKFDIYSAAATVYCLMFNKTAADIVKQIYATDVLTGQQTLIPLTLSLTENMHDRFGNAIGEDLLNFFNRCLDIDPNSRATAEEALTLLEKIK